MVLSRIGVCFLIQAAVLAGAPPWKAHGPLRVSANHRYIEHRDGAPFLWLGDTAWALFYKLNREEVRTYLDDRQKKGFTVIQAVAYWFPHGEDGPGPHNAPNAYGHRPFEGADDEPQTSRPAVRGGGSLENPNDYWDHADFIVREVKARGMYLALLPCWGRAFINATMEKSRPTLTEASARDYGRFLGKRYRREPHIIWVIGGDINPTKGAADRQDVYRAMAEAIGQGTTGADLKWNQPHPGWDNILMTYHPEGDPFSSSSKFFHAEPWLDVNGIETWKFVDQVQPAVAHNYSLDNPVKPTLFLEGAYEGGRYAEPGGRITDLRARRQAWQAMLAGAAGHTYGASSMWHFQSRPRGDTPAGEWKRALDYPGAAETGAVLGRLLREQKWWTLTPDQSLISEGAGSGEKVKTAARSAEGGRILVYFPDATPARLKLPAGAASPAAAWFRTTDGTRQPAAPGSSGEFTPPSGWADALLVIEASPSGAARERER